MKFYSLGICKRNAKSVIPSADFARRISLSPLLAEGEILRPATTSGPQRRASLRGCDVIKMRRVAGWKPALQLAQNDNRWDFFRSLLGRASAAVLILLGFGALFACNTASARPNTTPDPAVDESVGAKSGQQTLVLAGGCFWGQQLVFEHVKGVVNVTAGYSGGSVKNPSHEMVSSGATGHAESVRIVYDPSQVTLGQILKVFFSVAHDPTELNRQGPDDGTQYRSAIFFEGQDQQRIAQAYVDQLNQAKVFSHKIVTQVVPFQAFYPAEGYHQDYAVHNPYSPYIRINDLPKLDDLRKQLPSLYVAKASAYVATQ